ncbi:MAG TPA: FAD-binding protein [Gaiellaceae bacterium]
MTGPPPRLAVAGAGMAGLATAARLAELGAAPVVFEKGDRAGGSMLLSSGVIWRHASFEEFRAECHEGDPALQHLIWSRLDAAIEWLRRLGAPVVRPDTGNPRTVGVRFETRGLVATLVGRLAAGSLRLGQSLPAEATETVTVLATGGFGASPDLVARHIRPAAPLRVRGTAWSTGDGLVHGLARGGALSSGMGEFYGRNMPDRAWTEDELVPVAQLYGAHARIFDESGKEFFAAADVSWAETNVCQATATRPGARAYYLLTADALNARIRDRSVADIVALAAPEARVGLDALPFSPPAGIVAAVRVAAAITHTIGGLRVNEHAQVLGERETAIPGLFAAGIDAGGVSAGGYSSGLAQALVLGLAAAEAAVQCI